MRVVLILLLLGLFSSCKKEYCWTCHSTEIWRQSNGTGQTFSSNNEVCNKTEKEIKEYEKKGNYTKQDASQGITIVHYMSCTK